VFSLCAMSVTNMAFLFALDAGLAGIVTGSSLLFLLAFVRVWFGVLSPGLQPASMAAMTDATTPANRAAGLGMLGAGMSIGSILGPAGAAALAPIGALAPIWGSIVLCLAVAAILAFALPKTVPRPRHFERPKPLAMSDARMRPHLAFLVSYFVGVGMVQQTLAWFIEDRYQLSARGDAGSEAAVLYTGIAFACMAVATIIVQFGYMSRVRPDPRRMLPLGLGLVVIGYIGADVLVPFPLLCASFLVVGIGSALAIPSANALGSLAVPREQQGAAAALLAAAPPAGFIFGPILGAAFYQLHHALPLIAAAMLMAGLTAYALFVTSRQPAPAG
jgi:MFS family permease